MFCRVLFFIFIRFTFLLSVRACVWAVKQTMLTITTNKAMKCVCTKIDWKFVISSFSMENTKRTVCFRSFREKISFLFIPDICYILYLILLHSTQENWVKSFGFLFYFVIIVDWLSGLHLFLFWSLFFLIHRNRLLMLFNIEFSCDCFHLQYACLALNCSLSI